MKRCPQCSFIYLDTDETCDLDQTPLVFVDEAEVDASKSRDAATPAGIGSVAQSSATTHKRRPLVAIALGALLIAFATVAVYFGTRRPATQSVRNENSNTLNVLSHQQTAPEPLPPSSSPSPTIDPSPSPIGNSSAVRETPGRGAVSSNPVSTGHDEGTKTGAVTIRLTTGARIEADEAWRTKEGIWYRRNGMVTLLKRNQVRAIERK